MFQLVWNKKAISNTVFIGSVVVLAVVCVTIGFVGYYKINDLQSSYNQLHIDYQNLLTSYNQLQSSSSNYQNLQTQYNQLQSSYNQLNSQYQTLLSRIPNSSVLLIESIDYNRQGGGVTPSGVTNVTVRNTGSTDIHVTSLKLYHGTTILASSVAVLVTVPANSAVSIPQFLHWDSTLSNSHLTYTLTVETLEGYTATSDQMPAWD